VVHCVAAVPAGAAHLLSKDDLRAYYDSEAEKVFAPVRAFFERAGWPATFVARIGPAAENISTLATQGGFDLLVMGTHGHGAFGKLMLGSVATKVMAQCGTPVLLVR
jgi:nucleotide-binding universal stress UspA family protein